MKLSEFECADCGATINEGEYVTFGVCDKCFQKNYRERMGLPEEKKNTMENMTKEQAFDYSGWSRDSLIYHIMTLENKLASGSVAAPKEEEDEEPITDLHPDYVKEEVAKLMVYKIQAYEQLAELASLRQQLKEREEALKELLKFADMYIKSKVLEYARGNFEKSELEESAAIIERARNLLSK